MRMIPSVVGDSTSSDAERRVFELLKSSDLGPGARAIHSLNISEHDYKLVGELDFVVICARGLLVLEVKGGGVAFQSGLWRFTDRFGAEHRRSEGPFRQARSGMFSLIRRLEEMGVWNQGMTAGYGVVLPDCELADRSVEWADEMVLDEPSLRGRRDLGAPLRRLFEYWESKRPSPVEALTPERIEAICMALRPDFDRAPSLRHRADAIDRAVDRLTSEQCQRLDVIEENRRILCTGGAGTGKTFLAAELARRHATAGDRVLLLAPGAILAAFLDSRVSHPNVTVTSMERLDAISGAFDALVVDEGQDVMNYVDLDRLDRRLRGGLQAGTWRIFLDPNRQTGVSGDFDPEALQMLRDLGAVTARLRTNCRNTRQVATQTRLLTAADLGSPSAGDGPPVTILYFEDEQNELALLEERITALQRQEVAPEDITILSPLSLEHSCAVNLKASWKRRMTVLDECVAANWPPREMTFATISDFKGLENRFVLVVDIRSLDSEIEVNQLYVAMSRARAALWMALDRRLEGRIDALSRTNLQRVLRDAATGVL